MALGGTMYADRAQVALSIAEAQVGGSVLYALGPSTDPRHPTVMLVSELRAAGTISTHLNGRDPQGRLQHIARRLPAPAPAKANPRREGASAVEQRLADAGIEGRVLGDCLKVVDLIAAMARAGALCPSNSEIARRLGLRDRERAKYLIKVLIRSGAIAVWSRPPEPRVVQIVGTGLMTFTSRPLGADGVAAEIERVFGKVKP